MLKDHNAQAYQTFKDKILPALPPVTADEIRVRLRTRTIAEDMAAHEAARQRYYRTFYPVALGLPAYRLWEILRLADANQDGRVDREWRIDDLAALMGTGDRYTLTGRNETKTRPAQVGAMDRLQDAGLITYQGLYQHKARRYRFTVAQDPGRLTEAQRLGLPGIVRDLEADAARGTF